jgi:hypothetical protein
LVSKEGFPVSPQQQPTLRYEKIDANRIRKTNEHSKYSKGSIPRNYHSGEWPIDQSHKSKAYNRVTAIRPGKIQGKKSTN